MDRTEEQYDPDGDVSRFLGSPHHPGPLLSPIPLSPQEMQEPMLSQLPEEGHHHGPVPNHEILHALPLLPQDGLQQVPLIFPQEAVHQVPEISSVLAEHMETELTPEPLSVEGAIIAAMEGIQLEGSSSSNPRNDSTYEPIFHHYLPGHRDCNNCVALRIISHTSPNRNLLFIVHGGIGSFDHAVFDVQNFGRDGRPTTTDRFYVDLSMRSHKWVKSFIVGFTTLLQTDTSGTIQDPLNSFYNTLCADMDTGAMDETLCMDLVSWFQGSSDFEVGESSHSGEEIFENNDPSLDLPIFPAPTMTTPNSSEFTSFGTIISPAMSITGAVYSSGTTDNSGDIVTVIPESQQNNPVERAAEHAPDAYHHSSGQSQLAIQRQRTANMGLSDLAAYLHLPLEKAAKNLKMCSSALKKVCRRNGMYKWPSRQIKSINNRLQNLDKKLTERRKFLYGWTLVKEEMERLQRDKIEIYQRLYQDLNDNFGNDANDGNRTNDMGNNGRLIQNTRGNNVNHVADNNGDVNHNNGDGSNGVDNGENDNTGNDNSGNGYWEA